MATWRFRRMAPGEINENPVQGEFFSSTSDLPQRLVREAIQNSLDAAQRRRDGTPEVVRVRFGFSGREHQLSVADAAKYIRGLQTHVDAVAEDDRGTMSSRRHANQQRQAVAEKKAVHQAAVRLDQQMPYLVVEDFGTKGLTGDVAANGTREDGNNFWGFFRQIGISTKGENEAGSWGLGKWVFPDASEINSFLALTKRHGEHQTLMMGLAILKTHTIGESKYPAYGHFVRADERDDTVWQQMPVSSTDQGEMISGTNSDFRLQRHEESGLSVIIPWPRSELEPDTIARAVVTQYFLPIVLGHLEVVIEHPGQVRRVINSETVKSEVSRIAPSENDEASPESMSRLLDLVEWACQQQRSTDHIRTSIPTRGYNPLVDVNSKVDLEHLRLRYNNYERLAFELYLDVQRSDESQPTRVSCRLYVQRDDSLPRGHDYFVRGHLNIPGMDLLGGLRARTLLLVDGQSELGHLLRDSENPAHTDWRPRDRALQNWESPGGPIEQVRLAPRRLVQALTERPAERQLDALADLFPSDVTAVSDSRTQTSTSNPGGGGTARPIDPPITNPAPVQLQQVSGGFRLTPGGRFPLSLVGTVWMVKFAYELARGSKSRAFSLFDQGVRDDCADFSLRDGLEHDLAGCSAEVIAENKLKVTIESDQFRLSVQGFDRNRDVLVEVDQDKSGGPDHDEAAGSE